MRNLISQFAAFICVINITTAQVPTSIVETIMAAEHTIAFEMQDNVEEEIRIGVPIRVINNKNTSNIFIQPEVVLSEATLNIIDEEGNAMMAYHFNHLSEIDLSIKRLPVGDYTLNLHSKQGSSSHKVVR